MTKISSQIRFGSATLAIAAGMTAWAAPAVAQTPPATTTPAATTPNANDQPIVITGSRIRRDPLDQDQEVVFVDRADIDRTGLSSTAEVLQRLPGSGGALNSRFNNSGNFGNPPDGGGVGAGAAEADLRYLSSRRVLVLVDGLRYINGSSGSGVPGSVDLNSIPEAMIERIEVLQSSAAAIYGSDAIGGVINIISRRSQEGWIASAQLGSFGEGDGFQQNYALTWGTGTSEGGTRLVIGANYVKQDDVSSGDRSISLFPTPGTTACDNSCSSGTPLGRFIVLGNNLTLRHPVLTGRPVYNPLNPTDPASDYKAFTTADRFNFAPYNFIQVPLERYGGFVNFTQEIGERTHFQLRGVYNRRNSSNQAAPLPLFVGPDAGNGNRLDNISIDASNPFNPFGTLRSGRNPDGTSNGQIPNYNFIGRRVTENGPRRYDQSVDTYYAAATLDGAFQMGGHDWYWDVNGLWGRNRARQAVHGNINAANLTLALGPVAACTAPCIPFNIFGGEGSITQAMLDYVAFTQRDSSRQRLWDVTANLTGSLFDLPGGPVGLAIGLEHRDLTGRFDPDATVAAGLGSDIPALPTAGGYNVDEAYAEVRLPFLRDTPFFHRLEVTGAARYSDYSTSGSTTTFSAGVNWEPTEGLLFRGSWAEGFRAPSIGELFGTPSRFDQEVSDPCSQGSTATQNFTNNPTVRANCIAEGVPANGSYTQLNAQLPVITGGSDQLLPENSESWGFGAVWRPSFLPRLSLEANYYNITVDGAIAAIDAETLLGRCATTGDALSCAAIDRSASGQVTQIRGFLQNIGSIETDGIDLSLIYRGGQGSAGTFNLIWNASFLLNYRVTVPATTGFTTIDREGTEQGSPDQVFAKFKSTGIIDWTLGDVGASVTGRYISAVEETGGNKLNARFYTDLQLRWSPHWLNEGLSFAIGANNLFDTDPPACFTCGLNNMDPTTYDVPGTFFYGRVTFRMR
jgi:iron complex outermembrane receptor protein